MADQPPGAKELQNLRDAGVPEEQVQRYKGNVNRDFAKHEVPPSRVAEYWGDTAPNTADLDAHIQDNLNKNWNPTDAKQATNWKEALAAGMDMSSSSLIFKAPTTVLPEHAGIGMKIFHAIGQMAGDLPASTIGMYGGGAAGAALGGGGGAAAAAPTGETAAPATVPIGTVVGGLVGAGIGGAGLPEGIRQIAMDHYENGSLKSAADAQARVGAITFNTAKAAGVGAVAAPIAGVVGRSILGSGLRSTAEELAANRAAASIGARGAATLAEIGTFTATATTVGAAMEGHLPTADDFIVGAATAIGFTAAGHIIAGSGRFVPSKSTDHVAKNMRDIYARTGLSPAEQLRRAKQDPALMQQILARDPSEGSIRGPLDAEKLTEPDPYNVKTPEEVKAAEWTPEKEAEWEANLVKQAAGDGEPAKPPRAVGSPVQYGLGAVTFLENTAGYAKQHNMRVGDVVSPAGAIGLHQIMPGTAKQYMGPSFDVRTLHDDAVNEKVAKVIMSDLTSRYTDKSGNVDWEAVYIAYNAGPGRANAFIRNGRNYSKLPVETQRYLERADRAGLIDGHGKMVMEAKAEVAPKEAAKEGPKSSDDIQADILALIAEPDKASLLSRGKDLADNAYSRYVSQLGPAKNADKLAALPENEVGLEDIYRSVWAAPARAGHFMTEGAVEFGTNRRLSDESYTGAFKLAKENGGDQDGFVAYRLAKRSQEKGEQGVDIGLGQKLTPHEISQFIADNAGKYEAADQMINRVKNGVLDYYATAGMLSPEQLAAIKEQNKSHIPLERIFDDKGAPIKVGKGFQARQVVGKIKGSKRQIAEPIYAEIEAIHRMVAMADRNHANQTLVKLDPESLAAMGVRHLEEKAAEPVVGLEPEQVQAAQEKIAGPKTGKEFVVYVDGKPVTYEASDPLVAAMIRGGTPADTGVLTGVARFFASIQRTGITALPDYLAKMVIRDQFTAPVLSKYAGAPFQNLVLGAMHVMGNTERYLEFIRNGGMGAALADMDARYIQRDVERVFASTGALDRVVNVVQHPVEASRLVMERIDAMSRLGLYVRQTDNGVPTVKAAMRARTTYLDFAESGTSQVLNWWAGITPFLRPTVLGIDQMVQEGIKNPMGVTLRAGAYITVPTLGLWVANYYADKDLPDKEKYANLPTYQRDLYWITPPIQGQRIRIPKPRELGLVFGSLPERMLNQWASDDPKAFEGWAESFMGVMFPNVVPAVATPILEQVTNHSMFTNRPLIPSHLEDASDYMQYSQNTSGAAKALANVLGPQHLNLKNISPIVLDNYVRDWAGGLGTYALAALDAPDKVWNYKEHPPSELADMPFIKSFLVRHDDMGAKPIEEFYDELDKIRTAHKDLNLAIERGDPNEIDFTKGNIDAKLKTTRLATFMSQHRKLIDAVGKNEEMTQDEKRQRIEGLYTEMFQTAKQSVKELRDIRERMTENAAPQAEPGPDIQPQLSGRTPASYTPAPAPNQGLVPIA